MGFESFLQENGFSFERKISKGHSSEVFLIKHLSSGNFFALKKEKASSRRKHMLFKEVSNLYLANSKGIGPRLYAFDPMENCVVMEFIEGPAFSKWLEQSPSRKDLEFFVKELLKQAKALDELHLDHGQLAGKGKNILVRIEGKNPVPVVVDFEKASQVRKTHNVSQLEGFLFKNPNGFAARKVKEILQLKE
ncbi:MAG TPA: hypothetical protein HA227_02205 [Candidatus Diapherotrites archaeon]|uniref:Protein kinase domain-containing protein n=1 Tax=Candidatus Iainarchaeum sp. TaxID=3101447 RepID=A0A7J4KTM7_9ARCH|nr:hypothetical protein [Candidatus Diapherotrites archaeon]